MSVKIPLPFLDVVVPPGGTMATHVIFAVTEVDEADDVTVTVSAVMTMRKWQALGRPNVTEVELGDD